MTLTLEPDLDSVKMNQHAKNLGQKSFILKVIFRTRQTQTHTGPIALSGPLKWSVMTGNVLGSWQI